MLRLTLRHPLRHRRWPGAWRAFPPYAWPFTARDQLPRRRWIKCVFACVYSRLSEIAAVIRSLSAAYASRAPGSARSRSRNSIIWRTSVSVVGTTWQCNVLADQSRDGGTSDVVGGSTRPDLVDQRHDLRRDLRRPGIGRVGSDPGVGPRVPLLTDRLAWHGLSLPGQRSGPQPHQSRVRKMRRPASRSVISPRLQRGAHPPLCAAPACRLWYRWATHNGDSVPWPGQARGTKAVALRRTDRVGHRLGPHPQRKPARSQITAATVMGIGMTMPGETIFGSATGRIANAAFGTRRPRRSLNSPGRPSGRCQVRGRAAGRGRSRELGRLARREDTLRVARSAREGAVGGV